MTGKPKADDPGAYCAGKLRFRSFLAAAKAAKRSNRAKSHDGDALSAYACHACSGFHVGTNVVKRENHRPRVEEEIEEWCLKEILDRAKSA